MKSKRRRPRRAKHLLPAHRIAVQRYACVICGHITRRLDPKGRQLCSTPCKNQYERLEKAVAKAEAERIRRANTRIGRPPLTDQQKRDRRVARALEKLKSSNPLTEDQQRKMRAEIAACARDQLKEAHKQVMGTSDTQWTPTQARVFGIFMGKVLPDLRASHVVKEEKAKPLNELSRAELEALVARAAAVESTATPIEDAEVTYEDP